MTIISTEYIQWCESLRLAGHPPPELPHPPQYSCELESRAQSHEWSDPLVNVLDPPLATRTSPNDAIVSSLISLLGTVTMLINRLEHSSVNRSRLRNDDRGECQLRRESPPTFESIRSYRTFKMEFEELIGSQFSSATAFRRLRNECVKPGSFEHAIVRNKESVEDAFYALDRYYSDPELVQNAVLSDLRSLPSVRNQFDAAGLLRIVAEVNCAMEDLREVNRDSCGGAVLSCVMLKIPDRLRLEIDLAFIRNSVTSTSDKLSLVAKLLEEHCQALRRHDLRTTAYTGSQRPRDKRRRKRKRSKKSRRSRKTTLAFESSSPRKALPGGRSEDGDSGIVTASCRSGSDSTQPLQQQDQACRTKRRIGSGRIDIELLSDGNQAEQTLLELRTKSEKRKPRHRYSSSSSSESSDIGW